MDRVCIQSNRLTVSVVVSSECIRHILQRDSIIHSRRTIRSVQPGIHEVQTVHADLVKEGVHWVSPRNQEFVVALDRFHRPSNSH